ncbi:NADH-quinone oxidoreductase subunit C [Streptomyces sp. SLBN-134]|uniref:NADH-quinone oxidoreductase subunit C n=1 Tax=Streptomyces sp. SLBN-134 TaxID=2768456 RepID=UPI001153D4F0|nr:NADH-quinone oxidoreductase subunit C [Streptomyces sp. SLBN-134]TQL20854.1 NADH:ubiquinone oxidoreductase subunit C [Streptomyces sp. SLBN-134]
MTAVGWLPAGAGELFGEDATAEESYGVLTVDVPPGSWIPALEAARDRLGCTYFDWLSAVDEPGTGFRVTAHVVALAPVRRLLLRTTVPHEAPVLPSAVDVYAGAAWHERETHEMFGVGFTGHPGLDHLLLPDNFEGHPLRKDFVLAARVAKAWPGAKEPGEPAAGAAHGGPKRRQMLPPGVPDPNEWGPLKGQLPPAPSRPARAGARPPADRPRRTRTAGEGSASQPATPPTGTPAEPTPRPRRSRTAAEGSASQSSAPEASTPPATGTPAEPTPRPRRSRTAAEGSASQSSAPEASAQPASGAPAEPASRPRRSRTAAEGSASQSGASARPETGAAAEGPASQGPAAGAPAEPAPRPRRSRTAGEGSASQRGALQPPAKPETGAAADAAASRSGGPETPAAPATPGDESAPAEDRRDRKPSAGPRSPDAPWHHARPAFEGAEAENGTEPEPDGGADAAPAPGPGPETGSGGPDSPTPEDDEDEDPSGGRR